MSEVETSAISRPQRVRAVDVRVSADAEQVPLVRSFAADIAMRLDFDLDAIEDLRMAVDEACSLLVRAAVPDTSLHCAFVPGEQSLLVRVHVEAEEPLRPSRDPMSWQILTALTASITEGVEPTARGHRVTLELLSRPTEAAPR